MKVGDLVRQAEIDDIFDGYGPVGLVIRESPSGLRDTAWVEVLYPNCETLQWDSSDLKIISEVRESNESR